ncbi:hypothetical protein BC831DRAFT_550477 [Entophlyctis helioformis]|nr:hypothetical protein BC831DRAFT_550477 [Entophlyctis helioformis]
MAHSLMSTIQLPSGNVMYKGMLTQRKLAAKSRRQVVLCQPSTPADIAVIHDELALISALKAPAGLTADETAELAARQRMEVYGHIALSAVSGYPLLIVGTSVRQFIHFSQIQALADETELQSPCAFSVITTFKEFKFSADTSYDYQNWIMALSRAIENLNGNIREQSYRPLSPEGMADTGTRAGMMSPIPSDADQYVGVNGSPAQDAAYLLHQHHQNATMARSSVSAPMSPPSSVLRAPTDIPESQLAAEPIAWDSRLSRNVEVLLADFEDAGPETGVAGRRSTSTRSLGRPKRTSTVQFVEGSVTSRSAAGPVDDPAATQAAIAAANAAAAAAKERQGGKRRGIKSFFAKVRAFFGSDMGDEQQQQQQHQQQSHYPRDANVQHDGQDDDEDDVRYSTSRSPSRRHSRNTVSLGARRRFSFVDQARPASVDLANDEGSTLGFRSRSSLSRSRSRSGKNMAAPSLRIRESGGAFARMFPASATHSHSDTTSPGTPMPPSPALTQAALPGRA